MRQVLGNHCVFWSGIATTNQDLGYFQLRSIDSMVLLMYMAVVKREDLFFWENLQWQSSQSTDVRCFAC